MKKITKHAFLVLFISSIFVGFSNADKHSNAGTTMGTGTVYESCEDNQKKFNIYREDITYKQLPKLNKKGNTTPCRFGLVENESPVKNFIKKLF